MSDESMVKHEDTYIFATLQTHTPGKSGGAGRGLRPPLQGSSGKDRNPEPAVCMRASS